MSNMSYCRFQNTRLDLKDCVEALEEIEENGQLVSNELSREELLAMREMVEWCERFIETVEVLDDMENGEVV